MSSSVWAIWAAQAVRKKVDLSFSELGGFFNFLWAKKNFKKNFENIVASALNLDFRNAVYFFLKNSAVTYFCQKFIT